MRRRRRGRGLARMTFSGGMKGLMLEAAERNGLSFPPLQPETNAKVSEVLGVGTSLGNPLDAGFAALSSSEAYFRCIEVLLADPNIDVLLLQEELPPAPRINNKVENLKTVDAMVADRRAKPIAIVSMISYMYHRAHQGVPAELQASAGAAGGRQGAARPSAAPGVMGSCAPMVPEGGRRQQARRRRDPRAPQSRRRRAVRARRSGF